MTPTPPLLRPSSSAPRGTPATASSPSPRVPDGRLAHELRVLAERIRSRRLHASAARAWLMVAVGTAAALALARLVPSLALLVFPAAALAALVVIVQQSRRWARTPLDYATAAAAVEAAHPELHQLLRTAIEQAPGADGRLTFLQERTVSAAFDHSLRHTWSHALPSRAALGAQLAHGAALLATFAVLAVAARPALVVSPRASAPPRLARGEVVVTPGDVEVERGTTVIVAAEFGGTAPTRATLVWSRPGEAEQRTPMARSLSDPVFAHTFTALAHDVVYRVDYDGAATPAHRLTVYDLPALVRADATLDYPAYTGLTDRRIDDTRRVSAVEGTQLTYEFTFNQPLDRAVLRAPDGTDTPLTLAPTNAERTRFQTTFPLTTSQRLTLHLTSTSGRTNPQPADLRLEVLPNRRPELKFTAPRGDQRVSPLEEVRLQATARDDFGLLDYGVGLVLGAAEPETISLRPPVATPAPSSPPPTAATLSHLVALEPRQVAPDQLVSWFAWADDHGPDGTVRRTTSDLFFAEVRPFDEIFREDAESSGQQQGQAGGGGGGENAELVELQRQISISLWKLRQRATATTDTSLEDALTTIASSQVQARTQLGELQAELDDPRRQAAAAEAARFMEEVSATVGPAPDALARAWTASQGAYQALLRLQPREARVAQQRGGGGGGGGRGNQRQLNQLQFRNADDRYETASQAQAAGTPQERERLETLARLRALAQRQQDVNERLQQLQTALAAAQDEAERERLRRELKRLEEEQRQMVADLDDVRQQMERQPAAGEEAARTREQLDETRDQMQRSREALERGEVSQALASGTRAQDGLDSAREDLRRSSASQFSEQLRDARRAARELTEQQRTTQQAFDELARGQRGLDDSAARQALAEQLDTQRAGFDRLTDELRQITEDAEAAEPRLHRQLYDLLREQGQQPTADQLENSAELLRRGFLEQAQELQPGVGRAVDQLRRGVERAAESVLGDEAATLEYAANELDQLTRELAREQSGAGNRPTDPSRTSAAGRDTSTPASAPGETPGESRETPSLTDGGSRDPSESSSGDGSTPGRERSPANPPSGPGGADGTAPAERTASRGGAGPGASGGGDDRDPSEVDALSRLLTELGREAGARGGSGGAGGEGPITGEGYGEWVEQLRTVESLIEDPTLRQRIAGARERAQDLRRDFKRHSAMPQWGLVESGILAPLNDARTWLRQELARRVDPTTLQPVDRDPVPDRYSENVQRYYEALGR